MSFVCTIHQTTPNLGMEERCIYTHVTPPVRVTVIRNTGDGLFKKLRTHMWQLESLLFSFFTDNRGKKFSIVFPNFAKGKLGIVPSLRLMDFLCQSAGRFVPQPETIFVKNYQTSITTSWIILSLLSSVPYLMHTVINPIHPNISMHILHTVLYTFPWVMRRRICLTIKSFLLLDSGVIM